MFYGRLEEFVNNNRPEALSFTFEQIRDAAREHPELQLIWGPRKFNERVSVPAGLMAIVHREGNEFAFYEFRHGASLEVTWRALTGGQHVRYAPFWQGHCGQFSTFNLKQKVEDLLAEALGIEEHVVLTPEPVVTLPLPTWEHFSEPISPTWDSETLFASEARAKAQIFRAELDATFGRAPNLEPIITWRETSGFSPWR